MKREGKACETKALQEEGMAGKEKFRFQALVSLEQF